MAMATPQSEMGTGTPTGTGTPDGDRHPTIRPSSARPCAAAQSQTRKEKRERNARVLIFLDRHRIVEHRLVREPARVGVSH